LGNDNLTGLTSNSNFVNSVFVGKGNAP